MHGVIVRHGAKLNIKQYIYSSKCRKRERLGHRSIEERIDEQNKLIICEASQKINWQKKWL